jgi:hypothetical protein
MERDKTKEEWLLEWKNHAAVLYYVNMQVYMNKELCEKHRQAFTANCALLHETADYMEAEGEFLPCP